MAPPPRQILATTVDEFASKVDGHEIGGLEFKDCTIRLVGTKVSNVVVYTKLPPPEVPELVNFVELDQLPAGKTAIWSGVIWVNEAVKPVAMFRSARP